MRLVASASLPETGQAPSLHGLVFDPQPLRHLFVEEAFARTVGLHPFSINHKLRDGALASPFHDFIGSSRSGLDVDVGVWKLVPVEEPLRLPAVGTPKGGVNGDFHEVRYLVVSIPGSLAVCGKTPVRIHVSLHSFGNLLRKQMLPVHSRNLILSVPSVVSQT